jgi:hypothetical protein
MAQHENSKKPERHLKTSPYLLVSGDGEKQEFLSGVTINEAKRMASRAAETHGVEFHVYKMVAKTEPVTKVKVTRV